LNIRKSKDLFRQRAPHPIRARWFSVINEPKGKKKASPADEVVRIETQKLKGQSLKMVNLWKYLQNSPSFIKNSRFLSRHWAKSAILSSFKVNLRHHEGLYHTQSIRTKFLEWPKGFNVFAVNTELRFVARVLFFWPIF